MCGIIGIIGKAPVADRLVEALKRLEYRGYDSAGLATLNDGALHRRRAEGKLKNLEDLLERDPLTGTTGIGHTRWATHGRPSEANAHPHANEHVAVVHNGIIENFKALRESLTAKGHRFETDTDTEVIAHLVSDELARTGSPRAAVEASLEQLHGAFALGLLFAGKDWPIYAARRGSPLVVGYGDGEAYLGSDAIALAGLSDRICYLEDGDWAEITSDDVRIFDQAGRPANRPIQTVSVSSALVDKGNYRHFMLKEIHEQPTVVGQTLGSYLDPLSERVVLEDAPCDFAAIDKVTLVACGTSYYAAMIARYWFERLARLPVEVDIASEFRYRDPILPERGLALFISQSGETADTLAALRLCKEKGQATAAIVNVTQSTMAREADGIFPIHAGPEIGVASTKAFTCQLAALAALAVAAGAARGQLDSKEEAELVRALNELPSKMAGMLHHDEQIKAIAAELADARDVLYLGRGQDYPLALEGALKLKEISYIHAEGYAAGEMKHGPIALIDQTVPVIVIAPGGPLAHKTASNMEEVIARGGRVILLTGEAEAADPSSGAAHVIAVPETNPLTAPMLYALPVQLLAYHTAVMKGTDVDQPRNLAKSVTVE